MPNPRTTPNPVKWTAAVATVARSVETFRVLPEDPAEWQPHHKAAAREAALALGAPESFLRRAVRAMADPS